MSDTFSFAHGTNTEYLEHLLQIYLDNPEKLDSSWQTFFAGYTFASQHGSLTTQQSGVSSYGKIESFIGAYRHIGHQSAFLNPLEAKPELAPELKPEFHGLSQQDTQEHFKPTNFGSGEMTLDEISKKLEITYCGSIGADFRDVNDVEMILWLQKKMEDCSNKPDHSVELKKHILEKLAQAEEFEKFLQTRYLGQKRFSAEGLETLIPLLDIIISEASAGNIQEVCLGMAHRGRLNVLANIMGKSYPSMLMEFEGKKANPFDIDGDVKYHMGFCSEVETFSGKKISLYLSPNPSHLEIVNPVLEGFSRKRQEILGSDEKVLPILLHGDAAFIGQGVVPETLNLSQLEHYKTGGTIHVITNNQIGFTTNPSESRSCRYSSDIAKIIHAPVLHVNADDPEAVVWVAQLAFMFRQKFKKDIVVDLIGYRRHGHNETDEPGFTQPVMYKTIKNRPTIFNLYSHHLIENKTVDESFTQEISSAVKKKLQESFEKVKNKTYKPTPTAPKQLAYLYDYKKVNYQTFLAKTVTSVEEKKLVNVLKKITQLPKSFHPHPKILRLYEERSKMLDKGSVVDWGSGELLAFGTLAEEGYNVRLSGQDCKRGTFSSRHGVVFDYETSQAFEPLSQVGPGKIKIINSSLSELGVLGFEFGYSIADAKTLVIWEAQFGDFSNGAQIVIDQFISASEAKWNQTSGLVLMLPHGHEGMGPEHSSARPERFLQICGNLNIQVCNVTTPAQIFHLLRRQMLRSFRKPLVIMTPKSLLRHPKAISTKEEFTKSHFHEIFDDVSVKDKKSVKKLLMCTGKIYYELTAHKEHEHVENKPIIRIEQLYPLDKEKVKEILKSYSKLEEIFWVQEEPQNMGAWSFIRPRLEEIIGPKVKLSYVGRKNSGSTAEGNNKAHQIEQERIIEQAFSLVCAWNPNKDVD